MNEVANLPPVEETDNETPTPAGDDHLAIGALIAVVALLLLCVVIILVGYVRSR